jgi:hypothetical protein
MNAILSERSFTIGRALGRTGTALARCWKAFLLVLVVIGLPEVYAFAWIDENFARDSLESLVLASAGIACLDAIGSAWLTVAALRALSGRAVGPATGAGRVQVWLILVPVYAVGNFAWNIGFGQETWPGFVIGIIAAIVIATALWVYTAVAVVEGHGLWTSLRRCLHLAAGNGWRIGMLVLLYLLAYLVIVWVAWNLFPFGLNTDLVLDGGGGLSIAALLNVALNQATTLLTTASYILLRNDKDGVPVEDVAPVFD